VKASFNRLAEAELIAAARYLQTEAGLGREFLNEYQAWEGRTRRFPASCPEIAHVTYAIRGDTLRILYVRSARQAPLRNLLRG
jgi:hypothetical protein